MIWTEKKERYEYRKAHGLCVCCGGRAKAGRTRCEWCGKREAMNARERYSQMTGEQKKLKYESVRKWMNKHPDNVAIYKSRKHEYNRRYLNGWEGE